MNDNFDNDSGLRDFLKPLGLSLLGSLPLTDEDRVPDISASLPARHLLLIGNGGSSFWLSFRNSPEFEDGLADPLDRWSRRLGNLLAKRLGGLAIFPFDGPPYPPFLTWAGKTGQVVSSRLSMFMHERFGLWHAYRFALALPGLTDQSPVGSEFKSACLTCKDKPCLQACPVNAFADQSYRADLCMDYLRNDSTTACRQTGCEARKACPVGRAFTYVPEHAKFHMDAFVKSRLL